MFPSQRFPGNKDQSEKPACSMRKSEHATSASHQLVMAENVQGCVLNSLDAMVRSILFKEFNVTFWQIKQMYHLTIINHFRPTRGLWQIMTDILQTQTKIGKTNKLLFCYTEKKPAPQCSLFKPLDPFGTVKKKTFTDLQITYRVYRR